MKTPPPYCPTEAEIAAACAEIRAGWTDQEHESRCVTPGRVAWRPPGCDRNSEVVERPTMAGFQGQW